MTRRCSAPAQEESWDNSFTTKTPTGASAKDHHIRTANQNPCSKVHDIRCATTLPWARASAKDYNLRSSIEETWAGPSSKDNGIRCDIREPAKYHNIPRSIEEGRARTSSKDHVIRCAIIQPSTRAPAKEFVSFGI